jgi:hypothetical protein
VTIDDYVFTDWNPKYPDMGRAIRERVVANFRGATAPSQLFDAQVKLVVEGIKTPG